MRRNGNIVRYTAEELEERIASGEARIDLERVRSMTEEELEASIDIDEEGRFEDWTPLGAGSTHSITQAGISIDRDVIAWFASKDANYMQRINDVLRDYIKAQDTLSSAAD